MCMNNKIKIRDKHNEVAIDWHDCFESIGEPLYLITFDCHTDTHSAFLCAEYSFYRSVEEQITNRALRINNLRTNGYNIENVVMDIKNDEQISLAIQLGFVKKAFVISRNADMELPKRIDNVSSLERCFAMVEGKNILEPQRPYEYSESEDNIYQAQYRYRDGRDVATCDLLSDVFIKDKLQTFYDMTPEDFNEDLSFKGKFILDIDLDYFLAKDAFSAQELDVFTRLVKNSEIITVAKEPEFVSMVSEGEMEAESSLRQLLDIINAIL